MALSGPENRRPRRSSSREAIDSRALDVLLSAVDADVLSTGDSSACRGAKPIRSRIGAELVDRIAEPASCVEAGAVTGREHRAPLGWLETQARMRLRALQRSIKGQRTASRCRYPLGGPTASGPRRQPAAATDSEDNSSCDEDDGRSCRVRARLSQPVWHIVCDMPMRHVDALKRGNSRRARPRSGKAGLRVHSVDVSG